nr:MAG TPA: hypothetical protein [Caudoviricetes sp.]
MDNLTASERVVSLAFAHSSNIIKVSLSTLMRNIVSLGLSVGLPIFAALISSPHFCCYIYNITYVAT